MKNLDRRVVSIKYSNFTFVIFVLLFFVMLLIAIVFYMSWSESKNEKQNICYVFEKYRNSLQQQEPDFLVSQDWCYLSFLNDLCAPPVNRAVTRTLKAQGYDSFQKKLDVCSSKPLQCDVVCQNKHKEEFKVLMDELKVKQ